MKRKVLIAIHQLNIGGVQKSLIPALDAIDYNENEVTLYVRKNRLDLLPFINKNVANVIVNNDNTKHYRKPYAVYLQLKLKLLKLLKMSTCVVQDKLNQYILSQRMKYEKKHYFSDGIEYDVAVSYIQGYTAKFVCDNIDAKRKIMFYRGSTDEHHKMHTAIMQKFDKIYCVSQGSKKVLQELYPMYANKMRVIDTFVDFESVNHDSNAYTVDNGTLTIASCGRITPEKGFDMAVLAAKRLKDSNLDFLWYFVGDGAIRGQIEKSIKEYGLDNNIIITGLKDNPYPYIKACDIYVQPSYEESFGRTIKEAMILKKPVVSTKTVGGCEQIINEKNGILTEISDTGIADGINLILNDAQLHERILSELDSIDYSKEMAHYKQKWKALLED